MSMIEMLRLLRTLIGAPDLEDEEAVREWVRKAIELAKWLSGKIPGYWDDLLVGVLETVVENDRLWSMIYGLITQQDEPDYPLVSEATGIRVATLQELRAGMQELGRRAA